MRHTFLRTSFALLSAFTMAGVSANACDGYVVHRSYQPTTVVYRSVSTPTIVPVVYTVEKPVISVATAVSSVSTLSVVQVDRRPQVTAGSTLNARALFLGKEAGFVFLKHGDVSYRCAIQSWDAESATFTLPAIDIKKEIDATIEVNRPDGNLVKKIDVRLGAAIALVQIQTPLNVGPTPAAPAAPSELAVTPSTLFQ